MAECYRKMLEAQEYDNQFDYATKSKESKRKELREKCNIRTEFQRDRDKIIHSKSFRRLKHKTQVFLSPEGDHYRTRLTHTLEVSQIARTVARALRLNEDLTEAIALGHDLGHTPFGHCGEKKLNELHPTGFFHNLHSARVVEFIEGREKGDVGMNLTVDVIDGIKHHSGNILPQTLEGMVVRYADKIAYLNHDMDDSIRANLLTENDIPTEIRRELGQTHHDRINNMIHDMVNFSYGKGIVSFTEAKEQAFLDLRKFMFENVYFNSTAKKEEQKAEMVLATLYKYFSDNPDKMPQERFQDYSKSEGIEAVKDYIAGMSDRYAVNLYKSIYIPEFWL